MTDRKQAQISWPGCFNTMAQVWQVGKLDNFAQVVSQKQTGAAISAPDERVRYQHESRID
jgi:hypothetical protein